MGNCRVSNNLRNAHVDRLVTKDIDLHSRRVKNASDSQDLQDYVTQNELNAVSKVVNNIPSVNKNLISGKSNFSVDNIIPKIIDHLKGLLGASSITDDGVIVKFIEQLLIDIGVTPAVNQIVLKANGLGSLAFSCNAANAQRIEFGIEAVGSILKARDTVVGEIFKSGGVLSFIGAGGQTVNTTVTGLVSYITIDLTTGLVTFSSLTPSQFVKTNGSSQLISGLIQPTDVPGYAVVDIPAGVAAVGATSILPDGAIPIAGKLYQLIAYFYMKVVGTAGTISLVLTWNDGTAARTLTLPLAATALLASPNIVIPMVFDGVTNLQYAVTFTGVLGSPTYCLKLTTQKLMV